MKVLLAVLVLTVGAVVVRPTDLRFTPESVEAMMGELEDHQDSFNNWELNFYDSIRTRIDDDLELTTAQFDKLREIYKDYCE